MKDNKGFTLIELLGVIVVLAIVALISMPLVLDAVSKSAKGAYEESLRNVISATDIYIASDEFSGMPDEGIEITSDVIKMKNKRFTSGIVFRNADGELELSNVSDGTYCGGGTLKHLIVIKSSCDTLDSTNPTLSIATNLITSSAITVAATANDPESGIASYQYSKDNGATWTSKQASSIYEFTGLTEGTTYDIKVKVYNNNVSYVLTATKGLSATTVAIPAPTYAVNTTDWTQSKTVTITYPERKEGYVYEYSLDEASTWTEVSGTDTTKVLTFNANGNVIARVSDGTNIVSGTTYEVTNINTTPPVIAVSPSVVNIYQGFQYVDSGVTASDDIEGDISSRIVTTGTVNINALGTYILYYNVTDNAGNNALQVLKQVNVISSTFTFTNAGQTGRTGPSQAQINSAYSSTNLAGTVTSSSGIQLWTAPVTGTYRIEVYGAQGGTGNGYTGGNGARMRGDFSLTAGTQLKILVGQKGGDNNSYKAGGGGGGTFVTLSNNSPLIVAGGGGAGGGNTNPGNGYPGVTSTSGTAGTGGGTPGSNGNGGGTSGASSGTGGGGGLLTNGTYGYESKSGTAFVNGGAGGLRGSCDASINFGGDGGFGGGSGGEWCNQGAAGAGGGYSGGAGTASTGIPGGGGSYNNGSNQSNSSGANSGHGKVIITVMP